MKKEIKKKDNRGGRREGAGRKKIENPRNTMLSFRVSELTAWRIKQLRDATKDDAVPFNRMLDAWVAELAQEYGID